MNQPPVELTVEQKFALKSFEIETEKMSKEQAQHFLVKLYEQMLVREAMYLHFLRAQWGIEYGPKP